MKPIVLLVFLDLGIFAALSIAFSALSTTYLDAFGAYLHFARKQERYISMEITTSNR
jgi:hypothetical protein